jgi:hypothetical protein
LSEEDNEAGELDEAEEVLSVEFPADEYAALPLYPGEENARLPQQFLRSADARQFEVVHSAIA